MFCTFSVVPSKCMIKVRLKWLKYTRKENKQWLIVIHYSWGQWPSVYQKIHRYTCHYMIGSMCSLDKTRKKEKRCRSHMLGETSIGQWPGWDARTCRHKVGTRVLDISLSLGPWLLFEHQAPRYWTYQEV